MPNIVEIDLSPYKYTQPFSRAVSHTSIASRVAIVRLGRVPPPPPRRLLSSSDPSRHPPPSLHCETRASGRVRLRHETDRFVPAVSRSALRSARDTAFRRIVWHGGMYDNSANSACHTCRSVDPETRVPLSEPQLAERRHKVRVANVRKVGRNLREDQGNNR